MNSTIRRALTVAAAGVSIFTLSTGTAFAHYCYRTDVPANSQMRNGGAWATQDEMVASFAEVPFPEDCKARIIAHIESLPENTLFLGPGLLAGGAVTQGKGPAGVGHLFADAMAFPECAVLFEE